MSRLMLFPDSVERDPGIEAWFMGQPYELAQISRRWFGVIRSCGADVCELLHDGHPTACIGGAAFAYVNAFRAHVNVGFFHGAALADPKGLLEGTGKYMRHVKLKPHSGLDAEALSELVVAAYDDITERLRKRSEGEMQGCQ